MSYDLVLISISGSVWQSSTDNSVALWYRSDNSGTVPDVWVHLVTMGYIPVLIARNVNSLLFVRGGAMYLHPYDPGRP